MHGVHVVHVVVCMVCMVCMVVWWCGAVFVVVRWCGVCGEHVVVYSKRQFAIVTIVQGHGADGALWVSSEMKCIADQCPRFAVFPPGHFLSSAIYDAKPGCPVRYFKPDW